MTKITEKTGQVIPTVSRDLTPFEEMDRMFDRMFDRLFERGLMRPFEWRMPEWHGLRGLDEMLPRIDVIDRDEEILVRAEVPGVRKEDVEVTLAADTITIKGVTHEEKEEKGAFFRSEIRHGTFTRTVHLPAAVKGDEAKARFGDGMLEVRLPKAERITRHTIRVE